VGLTYSRKVNVSAADLFVALLGVPDTLLGRVLGADLVRVLMAVRDEGSGEP
jgi:hypothetical protein